MPKARVHRFCRIHRAQVASDLRDETGLGHSQKNDIEHANHNPRDSHVGHCLQKGIGLWLERAVERRARADDGNEWNDEMFEQRVILFELTAEPHDARDGNKNVNELNRDCADAGEKTELHRVCGDAAFDRRKGERETQRDKQRESQHDAIRNVRRFVLRVCARQNARQCAVTRDCIHHARRGGETAHRHREPIHNRCEKYKRHEPITTVHSGDAKERGNGGILPHRDLVGRKTEPNRIRIRDNRVENDGGGNRADQRQRHRAFGFGGFFRQHGGRFKAGVHQDGKNHAKGEIGNAAHCFHREWVNALSRRAALQNDVCGESNDERDGTEHEPQLRARRNANIKVREEKEDDAQDDCDTDPQKWNRRGQNANHHQPFGYPTRNARDDGNGEQQRGKEIDPAAHETRFRSERFGGVIVNRACRVDARGELRNDITERHHRQAAEKNRERRTCPGGDGDIAGEKRHAHHRTQKCQRLRNDIPRGEDILLELVMIFCGHLLLLSEKNVGAHPCGRPT